ncbi:MAG: penicillin-binding protein 2 [Chloroflexi bacterium]|nr:penicillin-binding protein 2 [Chloroflexota bacterium]
MEQRIKRTGMLIGLGFVLVALALGYWQVFQRVPPDQAALDPRIFERAARIQRGDIVDRRGQPLAQTVNANGQTRREYPVAGVAPIVGYASPRLGTSGLEARYDNLLSGEDSPSLLARLSRAFLHRAQRGAIVRTTIDADVQKAAVAALAGRSGAIVALDPVRGDVLALASAPTFDPATIDAQWDRVRNDPSHRLFNRATEGLYPPGSTFKTVTAAAAVDEDLVNLDQEFSCTKPIVLDNLAVDCRNHSQLPVVDFREAYAWSCNRTFALTALGLGYPGQVDLSDTATRPYPWERNGYAPSVDRLRAMANRFGFERDVPFDLPLAQSRLADPGQEMFPALLGQTAFGQGQVVATPFQMALVAAVIANQGRLPMPRLALDARAPDGTTRDLRPSDMGVLQVIKESSAAALTDMMARSVDHAYAQNAKIAGTTVAGKTGTAEVGQDLTPDSWFIGFAPASQPRVAVAAVFENAGSGSNAATIAAQQVLKAALAVYRP